MSIARIFLYVFLVHDSALFFRSSLGNGNSKECVKLTRDRASIVGVEALAKSCLTLICVS